MPGYLACPVCRPNSDYVQACPAADTLQQLAETNDENPPGRRVPGVGMTSTKPAHFAARAIEVRRHWFSLFASILFYTIVLVSIPAVLKLMRIPNSIFVGNSALIHGTPAAFFSLQSLMFVNRRHMQTFHTSGCC